MVNPILIDDEVVFLDTAKCKYSQDLLTRSTFD